jgi:hypothetical protein
MPNPLCDTGWYLANNLDVENGATQLLVHYAPIGECEDRLPSAGFDPGRYRLEQGLDHSEEHVCHYLGRRAVG